MRARSAGSRSRRSTPSIVTRPAGRVVQPGDEAGERRLAGAGLADEGQRRARGHVERDVVSGIRSSAVVACRLRRCSKRTARHAASVVVDGNGVAGRRHVDGQVEVAEDPAEEGHRGDPLGADVEQAHERAEDARLQAS